MQASKQTTVLHQELKAAFLQGDESQASELFNERLRIAVRLGLFSAMEEDINILCGAKQFPDPESDYQRARSEIGSALKRPPLTHYYYRPLAGRCPLAVSRTPFRCIHDSALAGSLNPKRADGRGETMIRITPS
jgi:hypothetical protein